VNADDPSPYPVANGIATGSCAGQDPALRWPGGDWQDRCNRGSVELEPRYRVPGDHPGGSVAVCYPAATVRLNETDVGALS
jgi:hypothetical protein